MEEEFRLDPRDEAGLREYRAGVNSLDEKNREAYDKGVFTVSSGAIGVSAVLLERVAAFREVAGIENAWLLASAWGCLVFSLVAVVASHYFGKEATSMALKACDVVLSPGRPVAARRAAFLHIVTDSGGVWRKRETLSGRLAFLVMLAGLALALAFFYMNFTREVPGVRRAETSSAGPGTEQRRWAGAAEFRT